MNDLDLAIQKRVDAEVAKRMAPFVKRFMKVKAEYQALLETMFTLTEGESQANGTPQTKKPRAAISYTEGERAEVWRLISFPGMVHTIGECAKRAELSSRLAGAILRDLVKQGKVVEGPKNKFRAVVEQSSADGLDADEQV